MELDDYKELALQVVRVGSGDPTREIRDLSVGEIYSLIGAIVALRKRGPRFLADVVARRYGFFGHQKHTLRQLKKAFDVSVETIRNDLSTAYRELYKNNCLLFQMLDPDFSSSSPSKRIEDRSIESLGLLLQVLGILKKMGIKTVGELLGMSDQDLLMYKNFGRKSLKEVDEKLALKGLKRKTRFSRSKRK